MRQKVKEFSDLKDTKVWGKWKKIAEFFPGRTEKQCSVHYLHIDDALNKGDVKRKLRNSWTLEEDKELLKYAEQFPRKFAKIASYIPDRKAYDCCSRIKVLVRRMTIEKRAPTNQFSAIPRVQKGRWTMQEDEDLLRYF